MKTKSTTRQDQAIVLCLLIRWLYSRVFIYAPLVRSTEYEKVYLDMDKDIQSREGSTIRVKF